MSRSPEDNMTLNTLGQLCGIAGTKYLSERLDLIRKAFKQYPISIHTRDEDCMSPPEVAAAFAPWEVLHCLVEDCGVSLLDYDDGHGGLLGTAVVSGNRGVVEFLLDDPRRHTTKQVRESIERNCRPEMDKLLREAAGSTDAERFFRTTDAAESQRAGAERSSAPGAQQELAERFFRRAMEDPNRFIQDMTDYANSIKELASAKEAFRTAEKEFQSEKRRLERAEAAHAAKRLRLEGGARED